MDLLKHLYPNPTAFRGNMKLGKETNHYEIIEMNLYEDENDNSREAHPDNKTDYPYEIFDFNSEDENDSQNAVDTPVERHPGDNGEVQTLSNVNDLTLNSSSLNFFVENLGLVAVKNPNQSDEFLTRKCYVNLHNSVNQLEISNCKTCRESVTENDKTMPKSSSPRMQCLICRKFYSSKLYLKYHACTGPSNSNSERDHFYGKNEDKCKKYEAAYSKAIHYVCRKCGKCFSEKCSLMQHLQIHFSKNRYYCKECGKYFELKVRLNQHLKVHANLKPYACSECPKSFKQLTLLNKHIKVHFEMKPYECSQCGEAFTESNQLKSHEAAEHSENLKVNEFSCKYCNAEHKNLNDLERHYLEVHRYECKECKKTFKLEKYLRRHQEIHTTEKPGFGCQICGKKFSQKCNLKKHELIHSTVRPYVCEICGKGFIQKINLNCHYRVHTGERPFSCEECGKRYKQQAGLYLHLKSFHK